jgi:hypothetical protein
VFDSGFGLQAGIPHERPTTTSGKWYVALFWKLGRGCTGVNGKMCIVDREIEWHLLQPYEDLRGSGKMSLRVVETCQCGGYMKRVGGLTTKIRGDRLVMGCWSLSR